MDHGNKDDQAARLPPSNEEAERAVLGSVLGSPLQESLRVIDLCKRKLRITHLSFYKPAHALIWSALETLYKKSAPMDMVAVGDHLTQEGMIDRVGGYAALEGLINSTPTSAHAEYYGEIVRKRELSRKVINEAREIEEMAHTTDDSEQLIKGAGERFLTLADDVIVDVSNASVIDEVTAKFTQAADDYRNKRPVQSAGLPIPYSRLGSLMNGLQPGMIFIAGRPSQGKTTVALNMTDHLAVNHGVPVAIVNMDMQNKGRLFQRSLCNIAGVSLPKLKHGFARDDQLAKVHAAAERIKKAPIYVLDNENNLDVICAWIRMQVLKNGVKCVMIDYIQQISTGDPKVDSFGNTKMTVISSRLKKLLGELGIPFLVLSQLSRNADKEDRVPTMADLRDSGSLEQDAFQVLLTYRHKKWTRELEENYKYRAQWLDLAKYQDGETATVEFQFHAPYFKFLEAEAGLFNDVVCDPPPLPGKGRGQGSACGDQGTGALPIY